MYELITQNEANRVIDILYTTGLKDPINIEVLYGKYKIKAYYVTESYQAEHHGVDMNAFHLMDNNKDYDVLEYKNRFYEVFISFGEWGYDTRLNNAHITIGSSRFHDYNFQLELSQAIKDGKYLYIVKNISNLAGNGALVRLYRGLGKDRPKKERRRERFIEEFNSQILKFQEKEWVVISKISLEDLFNDDKSEDIFYDLVSSFLRAMLLVEGIGEEEI